MANNKEESIYRFLSLTIILIIVLSPWVTNGKYNLDLQIYINKLNQQGFWVNLKDNSLITYFLKKIFFNINGNILIYSTYSVIIFFFFLVLNRFLAPISVLTIIFFSFFNLFLNQFKSALAIVFIMPVFFKTKLPNFINFLLILLSFFFHYIVAFFITFILISFHYIKSKEYKKILYYYLFVLFLVTLVYFSDIRISYYMKFDTFMSFKFILPAIVLIINRNYLEKYILYFLFLIVLFLFLLSNLSSLSTRLSELILLIIIFYLNMKNKNEKQKSCNKQSRYTLLLSFGYFLFSFINIIILKISQPAIKNVIDYINK